MKVLIIKPSSLGDVVHALRVVAQVKVSQPDATIDWVIKKELEGIVEASGLVDNIYLFERGEGLWNYLRLASHLRKKSYDYVLDLQGLLRSAFLAKIAKGIRKLGRADGREGSPLFYESIGEKDRRKDIHAIERMLPFLEELEIHDFNKNLKLEFPGSTLKRIEKNTSFQSNYLLIFPESRRSEKIWPFFTQLATELQSSVLPHVVIAGNDSSPQFDGCIDLRGKVELNELPALIRNAKVIVSNDSAPLHLASALDKPLVALFGPTNPSMYGPYPPNSDKSRVFYAKSGNLEAISVGEVQEQIIKFCGSGENEVGS